MLGRTTKHRCFGLCASVRAVPKMGAPAPLRRKLTKGTEHSIIHFSDVSHFPYFLPASFDKIGDREECREVRSWKIWGAALVVTEGQGAALSSSSLPTAG